MKIEHVALWTQDLERSRRFYERYFGAVSNTKYTNVSKQYESYFLTFVSGTRLELMHTPSINEQAQTKLLGWAHIAMSLGSAEAVDTLTLRLQAEGYTIMSQPRTTGDGYYESVILDPDGNHIELTI